MARPCDYQKYLVLCCNNFLLGTLGSVVTFFAIIFLVQLNQYGQLREENVCSPVAFALVLGIIIFLLSVYSNKVISYCNYKQIILFLCYLAFIFIMAVSIEIWAIIKYTQVTKPSLNVLENYKETFEKPEILDTWNDTYATLSCCELYGVEEYTYVNNVYILDKCNNDTDISNEEKSIYVEGCALEILYYTKSVILNFIYMITGLIIVEGGIIIPLNVHRIKMLKKWISNLKKSRKYSREISEDAACESNV